MDIVLLAVIIIAGSAILGLIASSVFQKVEDDQQGRDASVSDSDSLLAPAL